MLRNVSSSLYITNVEKEGPFLKIWGQTDKKSSLEVEEALLRASATFDTGKFSIKPNSIEVGVLCCAKYADGKYYRGRITSIALISDGIVEVNFLDFGNKDVVPVNNLRSVDCFNPSFISLPPLSTPYILAEVVSIGGEWNEQLIQQIAKELRYLEANYIAIAQAVKYYFIKASVKNVDLGDYLVKKSFMQKTSVQTQEAVLLAMMPRTSQPAVNQPLLQYKSFSLEPNTCHEIFVSYITDGPCHFSVQLKSYEHTLTQLMKEINSVPLKALEELPIPGTICLAKCIEDNHICRAVVTSEIDSQYKIFYVDFGNTELVPPENLYQISFKFVIPKIMAIRLALAGVEKSTMTLEMQCAFKKFVDNRLLMMEVLPSAKKMSLPKCRVWDPETNIDVMDVLNQAAKFAYPDSVVLHKGFTHPVKVCFVYSCNRFYIQIKGKDEELKKLMLDLQDFCKSNQTPNLTGAKEGLPCCALFSFDQQWYRGLITKIEDGDVTVRYIDYGNEEVVTLDRLKVIDGQYLIALKPQAIECALNGYQNMSEDQERDNKLEELILDQEFTMRVVDNIGGRTLVDLFDATGATISTVLLEAMVAQTKIQTPQPRKIDSKKNLEEDFKKDKNQKQFSQSRPQRDDWRNNSRNSDTNSNASDGSWRQDNKGFKNRKEDDWHEKLPNNSFKNDRGGGYRGKNEGRSHPEKPRYRNEHDDRCENNWTDKPHGKNSNKWDGDGAKDNWNDNGTSNSNWNNQGRIPTNADGGNRNWDNDAGSRRRKFERGNSRNNDGDWKSKEAYQSQTDNNWDNEDSNFNKNRREDKWNKKSGGDWDSGKTFRNRDSPNKENYGDGNDINNQGSYRKKPFNREESSGSERSFGKGPRTSSRNENRPSRPDRKYGNNSSDNSWNVSTVVPSVADIAPNDAIFKTQDVTGKRENVSITWFHNPTNFFCQLSESQETFKDLMKDIQEFYKGRPTGNCVKGAPVIGLFPEDNVLYRAKVLDVIGNQYKIYYVDFGNISVVSKVWPIENKFMELPMQAIPCGLTGIEPIGSDWQSPDNFSNYFDKESLNCEFVLYDSEKYWVNLSTDAGNIGEKLVNDNVAKYSESTVIDFDISLLVGQQFRGMLVNVTDLSDFTIMLQSGINLKCRAHNLSSATEKNEDLLRENLNRISIVYADTYLEDKLEVTLYDSSGNKLNILSPDEGAFDNVEPLCPHLVSRSTINGFVPHVNETSVVIQPAECAANVESLLAAMFEYYNDLTVDNPIIPEEEYLYAVKSEDGNWYRGRVTNFNDEKATVTYIDYGNSEEIPFSNLRELMFDFFQWDTLTILVNVQVPTAEYFEQEVTASIYYGTSGWESEDLKVINKDTIVEDSTDLQSDTLNDGPIDDEIKTSSPLNETPAEPEAQVGMIESPLAQSGESVVFKTVDDGSSSSGICNSERSGQCVVLSHIDSPNEFYIQLTSSLTAIEELQNKILEEIESMPILENPSIGGLCAAPYSLDQLWYRSQILDADDDITTVRFVDYGNTDVIDNITTRIKTLTPELLSLEVYATKCRLKIKPTESEWSKLASDRFEELTSVEDVRVEFVDQDEKTNYVELYSNGENVKDILIRENLAVLDDKVVLEGKLTGFICHINSPSEFWIQLESCCAELEWIAEQLSSAASFSDLEELTPGSVCAAMYPDDGMWYRARILSNTVAGLEVLFIDYGNSCMCSNLKQLPEDLIMAPTLAEKCSLQKPEGLLSWSVEATEKFKEIAADGQTVFTIKKLTTGETSMVDLLVEGENVYDKLMPNTDNGYVTEVESLESISIKKDEVLLEEKYKLEKIPGVENSEEMLQKFKEINNEGQTLYRIEFLPGNTVRLYLDDFNDIRNLLKKGAPMRAVQSPIKVLEKPNSDSDDCVEKPAEADGALKMEPNQEQNEIQNQFAQGETYSEELKNAIVENTDVTVAISKEMEKSSEDDEVLKIEAHEEQNEIQNEKYSEELENTSAESADVNIVISKEIEKSEENVEVSEIESYEEQNEIQNKPVQEQKGTGELNNTNSDDTENHHVVEDSNTKVEDSNIEVEDSNTEVEDSNTKVEDSNTKVEDSNIKVEDSNIEVDEKYENSSNESNETITNSDTLEITKFDSPPEVENVETDAENIPVQDAEQCDNLHGSKVENTKIPPAAVEFHEEIVKSFPTPTVNEHSSSSEILKQEKKE